MMYLKYTTDAGEDVEHALTELRTTIGRSPDSDITLKDDAKLSRVHCGILLKDDACFVQDLQSKNGVYLNDEKIESAKLSHGDHIKVGSRVFVVWDQGETGASTAIFEVEKDMASGKGYHTILQEIVKTVEPSPKKPENKEGQAPDKGPAA